jgi:flagellar protein FliS
MNNLAQSALNQYQTTDNSAIEFSDPHALILRMMDGAIERIFQAKGAIQHKNVENKGKLIGKAIGIVGGLDACLDHDLDNSLAGELAGLYEYMNLRLMEANVENNVSKLDEVARLMGEIRFAWSQIPEEVKMNHAGKTDGTG